MTSLRGHVLVATKKLDETDFARTVILLLNHDRSGASGVILNRPVPETVSSLWQRMCHESCERNSRVNFGGPVSAPLVAVHDMKPLGEMQITADHLFVAAQRDHLTQLIHQEDHPLRLFVGRAAWDRGKLEFELNSGAWHVIPANREIVFDDDEHLWPTLTRKIKDAILCSILDIQHVPVNIAMN